MSTLPAEHKEATLATYEKNPDNIGALWVAKDDAGKPRIDKNKNTFLTGVLEINGEKISITVIKNGFKKEDKHPDFKIMKSKGKGAAQSDDGVPF